MAEEFPFLANERPWERAHLIVTTASDVRALVPHDPDRDVVVADGPAATTR